jgi:hypothetical protein
LAQFLPNPDGFDVEDFIEQLSLDLSNRYREAENELIQQLAARAYRDLQLQQLAPSTIVAGGLTAAERRRQNEALARLAAHRAQSMRELQELAVAITEQLRVAGLAAELVREAAMQGEAAAVAMLGFGSRLLAGVSGIGAPAIGSYAGQAVASLGLSLQSRLEAMNQRITRYPQDAYQRIVSMTAPNAILGVSTGLQAQQQAVRKFLAEGVTGFVDVSNRRWTIGAYAEMASRTAVNRAFNDATQWRLQQSNIRLAVIVGGFDACSKCGPWIGKIVSLDGSPTGARIMQSATSDAMVTVQVAGTVDQARDAGWNHPNCFPRFVPVSAPTGVTAADSRWFEGELVVIHTAAGRELSVTPNHPVLTDEGWVAAGSLAEGHNLVSYSGDVEQPLTSRPDHEGVEAPIGEVYETLRQSRHVAAVSMPGTAEDFHGDGIADSEVDVVLADRLLGSDGEPTTLQLSPESNLILSRVREPRLLGERSTLEVADGAGHAAHGVVSTSGKPGALLGARAGHAGVHGGGTVAQFDASPAQAASDHTAGDTVSAGELLDALAGSVTLDQVVKVERRNFAGHVYNLQTAGGWYTAQSIVVHNCRCRFAAHLPGLLIPQADYKYSPEAEAERERQRELERRIRSAKRDAATAPDDVSRKRAKSEIRDRQAEMREFIRQTGRPRASYREQLHFSDGP